MTKMPIEVRRRFDAILRRFRLNPQSGIYLSWDH